MRYEATLGWDLGGAHVKAAYLDDRGSVDGVLQWACPLWQGLDRLQLALDKVLERFGSGPHGHAVTMTGELVDLFEDRASGVRELLSVMTQRLPADRLGVYAGEAGFLQPDRAREACRQVASANWLASATLAAGALPQGILIDIGSTTTDLVAFKGQQVLAAGYDDQQRLRCQELVYTGVVRTPLMAVAKRAPFAGNWTPLMAEHFATTADIYRLTGELPEHADMLPSADNGEKSTAASARRLARMLGLDVDATDLQGWQRLAAFMAEQQLRSLADAAELVLSRAALVNDAPLVGAGVGRFLVRRLARRMQRPYVEFNELFACAASVASAAAECAPAVAVAVLGAASREGV